jgi:hypothetical protein
MDMRVIPETFPALEKFGVNVEMDDGTSRFDSALRDQGIIPDTFPQIGQFGGNVESDDGVCRFDTNGIFLPAQSHLPLQ